MTEHQIVQDALRAVRQAESAIAGLKAENAQLRRELRASEDSRIALAEKLLNR